jgi:putative flippase GtrA
MPGNPRQQEGNPVPEAPAGWRTRLASLPPFALQLIRFSIVGGLGTVTSLGLFFALVDIGGIAALVGLVVCFGVAVSQNYVLNELWTFATRGDARLAWRRYAKFVAASLVGLAVNTAAFVALTALFRFPLQVMPYAMGIAAGMAVNFLASRHLVFPRS